MSSEPESAASRTAPEKEAPAGRTLVPQVVLDALRVGGFLYVAGFVVILVHTGILNVPTLEAL